MNDATPGVIIVMGVSGAGKTTVGRLLAGRLGWEFADADDHHPPENVAKMAAGQPLDDADREPWLLALRSLATGRLEEREPLVLACSALKAGYRNLIAAGDPRVAFVFLDGSFELISRRLQERRDHYMPPALLQSQFEALEAPADALTLDVSAAPEALADKIITHFGVNRPG
jgi:gluconokinase